MANERKILLVEDDDSLRDSLVEQLKLHEEFETVAVGAGSDALDVAKKQQFDLLILDVMLPGIDGFEICHSLRGEPQTAQLPILMFSAKGQESDKATGLKVGADEYITKPVDREVLLNKVAAWLVAKG